MVLTHTAAVITERDRGRAVDHAPFLAGARTTRIPVHSWHGRSCDWQFRHECIVERSAL